MAESVDAADSKSAAARRASSTLARGTSKYKEQAPPIAFFNPALRAPGINPKTAVPYTIHTILTDNGIQFAKRQGTEAYRDIPFDRVCKAHHIEHRLTQVCHPWTNGQVERMNRSNAQALGRLMEKIEQMKASVRAKVEHPFHFIKNRFGLKKLRYRGLAKNTAQLFILLSLSNLLIAQRRLGALHSPVAS